MKKLQTCQAKDMITNLSSQRHDYKLQIEAKLKTAWLKCSLFTIFQSSNLPIFQFILIFQFFNFPTSQLLAQDISVIAKFDSSNVIKIGDQLQLHLKAQSSPNSNITWPIILDTISKQIEVINKTNIDTSLASDSQHVVLSQTLFITSFDSGYWAIPPFTFLSIAGKDTIVHETEPLLLQVNTIAVDTTQAIKEIKEPLDIPIGWDEIAPYVIGGFILLAIILLAIYFIRKYRNKPKEVVIEKKPDIPPHVIALQELEKLKEQQLWQNNQVKEYHAALSEIVRAYLEKRYQFNALEYTTDEIIQALRNSDISQEAKNKLKKLLILSDLAKFAKEQPLPNENELSMSNAIEFVNITKENNMHETV